MREIDLPANGQEARLAGWQVVCAEQDITTQTRAVTNLYIEKGAVFSAPNLQIANNIIIE